MSQQCGRQDNKQPHKRNEDKDLLPFSVDAIDCNQNEDVGAAELSFVRMLCWKVVLGSGRRSRSVSR